MHYVSFMREVGFFAIFGKYRAISRKQYNISIWSLWTSNRKLDAV